MLNLTRSEDDPALKSNAPVAEPPRNPLEDHDVALYVDGRRVSVTYAQVRSIPGSDSTFAAYFESTTEAALDSDVNAHESLAWNGFKPGDHIGVKIGNNPKSGVMLIEHIIMPDAAGGEALFRGQALTPIYNLITGKQLAAAEDALTIPVSQAVRMPAQGPQL